MGVSERRETLRRGAFHLCLDMQRLFAPDGSWPTPWMAKVLPNVAAVAQLFARRTVFTRFIPAADPAAEIGEWRRYYQRWSHLTLREIDPAALEIVDELRGFISPAHQVDKRRFSAFAAPNLAPILNGHRVDTLVITGAETDMCVLASVMEGLDRGYRICIVEDAVCSSSDEGHEAAMTIYRKRFADRLSLITTPELMERLAA
ncbi:Uncharacterised protein [Starkeya nomas]|uniref:Isochorismatase-like domain-containing protein n=1 Tax=Starkeya nomas TaxID=2666134 RepID=A0A5S9P061_9HYPH|nr:isochorismatase family cysteine hydrolase [Starkeya nomas]CAA0096580.1 Uncharacterised protein [Starkeya nomas]